MPNLRGKASAKKVRKLMKEKWARAKAKCRVDERWHDITAEPVLSSSASVECSGGVLNEGLCDVATEQEVISGSVCDHNPEFCDVTENVVPFAADDAEPMVFCDPPECNDWLCGIITRQSCVTTHSLKSLLLMKMTKLSEIDS
uniref:Uncharacterized protein n=1 Tax=Amphimedon queenslandica TaxID=400682 RepID=A0A1X7TLX7_AMPQE